MTPFLILAACAAPAARPAAPFALPNVVALGAERRPTALGAGDFDGDGRLDLVVACDGTEEAVILPGDGRGGFRLGASAPSGQQPAEIFVVDFDHDGRLDLAIANHEATAITLLRGDGKGRFRPAAQSPLTVHSRPHPHTIDGCDVDGDGWIDLVIDDWQENRLTLLRSDGKGGFRGPGTPIDVGRKTYRNLRLADVNGDGRCDIVAPSYDQGVVTVLAGDGRGGFAAGAPIPAGPAPFTVSIGDLNRDGRPDLAVQNYSGHITDSSDDALTFLLGDGKGGFRLGPRIPTGRGPFVVAAGDIDGDGFVDAATADYGESGLTVAFGGPDGLAASRTARVALATKPERVLLADFNGDGRADAVAASSEGHAVVVLVAK